MASTIAVSILADVKDLQRNLQNAEGSVKDFASTADTSAGKAKRSIDDIGEASDHMASSASQAAGGLGDLGGALSSLPGPLGALGAGMEAASPAIMGVTGAADLLNLATEKFPILAKAQIAATKGMELAQKALNLVMRMNPIGLIITALLALAVVIPIVIKHWDDIKRVTQTVWNAIKGAVSTAINAIKGVISAVFGAIRTVITTYLGFYKAAFTGAWNVIKTGVTTAWNAIKSTVGTKIEEVWAKIKGLPGKVTGLGGDMLSAGKTIMGKLFDGFGNAAGKAGDFAASIGTAIKNVVNTQVIDRINAGLDILETAIAKLPGVGRPNLSIPHLANGGITTGPTLALIGDNPGGREAVIPLDKYNIGGGGNTYNIYVTAGVGDPVAIGKEVKRYIAAADNVGVREIK